MPDWRDNMIEALVELSVGSGIEEFNSEEVSNLLTKLADMERGKPDGQRIGFAYAVDNYSQSGITTILNKAKEIWPTKSLENNPVECLPTDSVHKLECVIAFKTNQEVDASQLRGVFQDFFVESLDPAFCCAVAKVVHVHDNWYDMLIRYSNKLLDIYELVMSPDWIVDAVTKPAKDFGKRTVATLR